MSSPPDNSTNTNNSKTNATNARIQSMRIPEYAPVVLIEQGIFYLLSAGLVYLLRGSSGTLPILPSSVLLANLLSFSISSVGFMLFVFIRQDKPSWMKYVGIMQEVAFVFMFMYNVQFCIFSILVRVFHADDTQSSSINKMDPFILLFNADYSNPYGYASTTLHMVVSLVMCGFLLLLFIITHSFLRTIYPSKSTEWTLVLLVLFVQSQFFLYHSEHVASSQASCDMFMCDEGHIFGAWLAILGVWLLDFLGHKFKYQALDSEKWDWKSSVTWKYIGVHVLGLPSTAFVLILTVPWLHLDYIYTCNMIFVLLLLLVRTTKAVRIYNSKQNPVSSSTFFSKTSLTTAPSDTGAQTKQGSSFGTKQPKYFLKKPGHKSKKDL